MASDPTDSFLAALGTSGLLAPEQVGELAAWAAAATPRPDPTAVGREIARRGWLTPFQIKEVFRGRGRDLTLGPYRLLDLIGEGGMGRVYKARHTRLGRDVAVKVIRKEKITGPQMVRRFHQEVRAAAALSHPNVVLAFDADEVDGHHFFAMEYVDGRDLTLVVRDRGPLPVAEACEYVRQAALGLQHAYERGLVHRDVKPSNLLATRAGQVKVLDLGLALLHQPPDDAGRVTLEGYVLGTPDFLAPEQARNPQAVDTRADVYSLGATLFFLLAARPPYDGASPTEKLLRHVMEPPPDLLAHRPDAPPELARLVTRMMAKDPADRPATPLEAAGAVQPFCPPPPAGSLPTRLPPREPAPEQPPPAEALFKLSVIPSPRGPRPAGRPPWAWAAGLAVAAAVTLAGLGYALLRPPAADGPPEAEYVNPLGMRLVRLPGGTFVMGANAGEPGAAAEDGPAGEVTLDGPFYVSATEVTNDQFAQVMARAAPSAAVGRARVTADLPVESVTWDEAVEFCRRLTDRDTKKRRGWAYRLPTEAEWEYACRAGTATAFPFGDRVVPGKQAVLRPDKADRFGAGEPGPTPSMPARVGQTEANRFGLFDVCGNVAEWCQDRYAPGLPPGPRANPAGPPSGDGRAVRGGGWDTPPRGCRSAARRGLRPDARDSAVGFRVVLAPEDKVTR
jgi:formylglycine-generating enzyme required for sulfatase activity/tRNA A-37 threonylcarbamoyl transferase component Bud32